ncbi:MAG: hypothetical protein L0Y38_09765 [Methylococcaceae bacterium]|nr:hypothetical protein [Methylococcaceae bacterium]MCI0668780.1 hypothetical protein [Methylococcaceae bacterium]MCI0734091.1 hypothetical protein [Methylococcaceae bacterium]
MAKDDRNGPLRIHVRGMDDRSLSTFKLFLQGPCRNQAVPVDEQTAEVTLIDLDGLNAFEVFERERARFPGRPLMVSSLRRTDLSGTITVSKPINAPGMMAAIAEAKAMLSAGASPADTHREKIPHGKPETDRDADVRDRVPAIQERKPKVRIEPRRSTHQTAMLLDERAYSTYVGAVADININDPHQVAKAHYDKRKYLQAYVESAVKLARSRKRILQLNCGWQPITIFPHSNEVWIDADDRQTRAFCVVPIHSILDLDVVGADLNPRSIISPISPDRINADRDPGKFQSIDAFVWKVALWTSNGRVPEGIQLDQPVHLDRWPNLSRFVNIPHSLRIAALLIEAPMTLIEIAKTLNIRQQYVFSFFSAAMALGLAGQSLHPQSRDNASPARVEQQRPGLLRKILNRLKVG